MRLAINNARLCPILSTMQELSPSLQVAQLILMDISWLKEYHRRMDPWSTAFNYGRMSDGTSFQINRMGLRSISLQICRSCRLRIHRSKPMVNEFDCEMRAHQVNFLSVDNGASVLRESARCAQYVTALLCRDFSQAFPESCHTPSSNMSTGAQMRRNCSRL